LGAAEVKLTKEALGWPSLEPFVVPEEALTEWRRARQRGALLHADWQARWSDYRAAHPELAAELERRFAGRLPDGWDSALLAFAMTDAQATRAASGKVLNAIAPRLPELIGGSADLTGSNLTQIKGSEDFAPGLVTGRNFHFGVREHAMGAVLNGLAYHGGFIPFGGTFLIFSDYMRPAIRLAALAQLKVIYVFTHDSIGLGEDGPTHQPIEQLATLRAMPNMTVIRPSDPTETVEAWRAAIRHKHGPVALVLTRQKVAVIDRSRHAAATGLHRGGYVLAEAPGGQPEVMLLATGSEVEIALGAFDRLGTEGVRARVVSMPCLEYFARQPLAYREEVLPPAVTQRIAIEAAASQSWYRWVGERGVIVGIDRFGASAPYQRIYKEFGLTVENVVTQARTLIQV
jgi:transketolase